MKYKSDEWRIVDHKHTKDLCLIKNKVTGEKRFCSKRDVSAFVIQEYLAELLAECSGRQI